MSEHDQNLLPAAEGTTPATPAPTYRSGPAPGAIVLGLLGLLLAVTVLLSQLTELTIPWSELGPWAVVTAGIAVLLTGILGLRSSRTQP